MSSGFLIASKITALPDGRLTAIIPDGWQQGRGAFGGLVLALLSRALMALEPERPLRALNAELCGPALVGPAMVEAAILRRGGRLSFVEARLHQESGLVARASATLGGPMADAAESTLSSPNTGDWQEAPVIPPRAPLGPAFAQHFEYRPTGPLPFSASERPEAAGWIRHQSGPAALDAPAIIALLDAWWPAQFSVEERRRSIATVSFTAELHGTPQDISGTEPLFHKAKVISCKDGYFVELRELWQGQSLVALNQQTFVILA